MALICHVHCFYDHLFLFFFVYCFDFASPNWHFCIYDILIFIFIIEGTASIKDESSVLEERDPAI